MCYKLFMTCSRKFFTQAENILLISPFYYKMLLLVSSLLLFSYFQHKYSAKKDKGNAAHNWNVIQFAKMMNKIKTACQSKMKSNFVCNFHSSYGKAAKFMNCMQSAVISIPITEEGALISNNIKMNCSLKLSIFWPSCWPSSERQTVFFPPQN